MIESSKITRAIPASPVLLAVKIVVGALDALLVRHDVAVATLIENSYFLCLSGYSDSFRLQCHSA